MKARDVMGRRIVRVEHSRWYNEHLRRMQTTVERIVLDDGSVLYPFAFETSDSEGPAATICHVKRAKRV